MDSVGLFLQKCGLYLQTPSQCHFDVPYNNPHCLPTIDTAERIITTAAFNGKSAGGVARKNEDELTILDRLVGSDEQFPEEQQPEMVKTLLKRYYYNQNALEICLPSGFGYQHGAKKGN